MPDKITKKEEGSAMVVGCAILILGGVFNMIGGYSEMTAVIKPNPIFGLAYLLSGILSAGAGIVIAGRINDIPDEDELTPESNIKKQDSKAGLFYILIFFGGIVSLVGFSEATSFLGSDLVGGSVFMVFGFLLLGSGIYIGDQISKSWTES